MEQPLACDDDTQVFEEWTAKKQQQNKTKATSFRSFLKFLYNDLSKRRNQVRKSRSRGYNTFLSRMKFILLTTVKMPTIVDILTFISRINTIYQCIKLEKLLFFSILLGKLKFHATELSIKKVLIPCGLIP